MDPTAQPLKIKTILESGARGGWIGLQAEPWKASYVYLFTPPGRKGHEGGSGWGLPSLPVTNTETHAGDDASDKRSNPKPTLLKRISAGTLPPHFKKELMELISIPRSLWNKHAYLITVYYFFSSCH